MSWFRREDNKIESGENRVRTEGLWIKCEGCSQPIWKADLEANLQVCPKCGRHGRITAQARINGLFEPGYQWLNGDLKTTDPLQFVDLRPYKDKLAKARQQTGLFDAIVNVKGQVGPHQVVLSVFEFNFLAGSMGAVVGETIARAIDRAYEDRVPLITIAASGGARMMEGIVSLMQLAKVSTALTRLDEAGIPFISVLTDPTTGGVTASFAMLGDLNIAEPGALIGFAGPRVIEQTIRQKLPEGFQRSEFLLQHGFLDAIVPRHEMKAYIIRALDFMALPKTA
ncbi:MAG TPA: acetyl-CoA carboxylase, carboxyltransferase subunit beta [Acidobacteriaceae bacterium]|jgi:acetyl-CoA carboxylase carboxyl transferase subunit beta|nr:acetyl-CoA carboxylase, carboxyltransferase subunit beta [Acidobacteriaceae bacterium]